MKIPAKIEYAYKAIIELGLRYDDNAPVQVRHIAAAQKIPEKFLVQLLLRMKNAHLVDSSRGITGGYFLSRPPGNISLADVINAIDDSLMGPVERKRGGAATGAEKLFAHVWDELNRTVRQRLEGVRLDSMVARLKDEELMYQI